MSLASAPALPSAEAPPLSPAAFLALREIVQPQEMAYRRSRLKGATRFFGLDLHREYVVAYAVDEALTPVVNPTTVFWERFPAWCAKTIVPKPGSIRCRPSAWKNPNGWGGKPWRRRVRPCS